MSIPSLIYGEIDLMQKPFAAQVGTSFGAWKSITSETSSLFLDGSVVAGEASANRSIVLSVRIVATTRSDIIAASELLIGEANRSTNVLVFDAGEATTPVVYETFRTAEPTRTDDESEAWDRREYTLTIPALPFARSDTRRTPALSFPPGTGGTVAIVDWGTTSQTGVVARDFAPSPATSQGIPVTNVGSFAVNGHPGSVMGGMTAVSNCTITSTSTDRNVVATAAGVATAKSTTPQSTSADAIIVGLSFDDAASADIVTQVGVEWFNGATSLLTDWGTPVYKGDNRPAWAGSPRPTAATAWGYRVRTTATSGGQAVQVTRVLAEAETFASVVPDVGTNLAIAPIEGPTENPVASWTYLALTAPVNVSALTHLQETLFRSYDFGASIEGMNVTFRLHSSGNKWSAWYYRPDAAENSTFPHTSTQTKFFPLSTPDLVSDAGAAVLTAVNAASVDVIGLSAASFDTDDTQFQLGDIAAGLGMGVIPPSTRGVVFNVDTILGSARSPAAITALSTTALTDLVLQAVDPDDGPPLLTFVSSVATATAPQSYEGVYSLLGTRVPAGAPTTPTLTIVQKHGGTTVKTVSAIPGTIRPGDHYVDFGAHALPLVAIPDENVSVSLIFTVTPTEAAWGEMLVLNTNSPIMMCEQISPTAKNVFVDEPAIDTGLGKVWQGNNVNRSDAFSPITPPVLSLPFTVKAPGVKIFAYSTSNGPSIALAYYDRWLVEPA